LEGCDQALVGQQWGVDAAGQVPQVIERGPEFVLELDCQLPDAVRVPGGVLQQAELDREGDELLLCPVVQVTFDLPPLGVLCFYQPAAGGFQLVDRGPISPCICHCWLPFGSPHPVSLAHVRMTEGSIGHVGRCSHFALAGAGDRANAPARPDEHH
jgi:hypothetical protein